jgi:hypothetical protein
MTRILFVGQKPETVDFISNDGGVAHGDKLAMTARALFGKLPDGQIKNALRAHASPAPMRKIFHLTRRANQCFSFARLTRERGGSRSSRTLR